MNTDHHEDQSPIEIIEQLRERSQGRRVVSIDQLAGRGHILLDGSLAMKILNDPSLLRPPILRRMVGEGLPWTPAGQGLAQNAFLSSVNHL